MHFLGSSGMQIAWNGCTNWKTFLTYRTSTSFCWWIPSSCKNHYNRVLAGSGSGFFWAGRIWIPLCLLVFYSLNILAKYKLPKGHLINGKSHNPFLTEDRFFFVFSLKFSQFQVLQETEAVRELSLVKLDVGMSAGATYLGAAAAGHHMPRDYAKNAHVFYHFKK